MRRASPTTCKLPVIKTCVEFPSASIPFAYPIKSVQVPTVSAGINYLVLGLKFYARGEVRLNYLNLIWDSECICWRATAMQLMDEIYGMCSA